MDMQSIVPQSTILSVCFVISFQITIYQLPNWFTELPTSGGSSTATGPGLTTPSLGGNTFTIQARDANGKIRVSCGDSFTVTATGTSLFIYFFL